MTVPVATLDRCAAPQAASCALHPAGRCAMLRAALWAAVTIVTAIMLLALWQRSAVAPIVEADNAYIFLAADRMWAGHGATSIPPRAPLQPWAWRSDWAFLTQWPVGYPLLICAVRVLTGSPTAQAATALGVVCCAVALVAWFAWVRSCLPRGLTANLVALVAAGATFSIDNLMNPASDTVLLALLPIVLMLARWALRAGQALPCTVSFRRDAPQDDTVESTQPTPSVLRCALVGIVGAALVWVRYAAIFVPAAIGMFLAVEWCVTGRARLRHVLVFAMTAALPVAGLVLLDRALGPEMSAQEQFNLGRDVSWSVPTGMFATAWTNFTRQTPYAHRPEAAWFYALLLPVAAITLPLIWPRMRRDALRLLASPPMLLSACCAVVLLVMLIAASTLFQGKYNFVAQARYYQPVRPLYFLLFLGPLTEMPWRVLRAAACVPLVMACSWFVNQDARRAYARMSTAPQEVTDYGRCARHFAPGGRELFAWLRGQAGSDLVVFSNFHEEIALETGIPAGPTPQDPAEMRLWLARIRAVRGVAHLRVFFVLNPDNDYRDYFLPPSADVIARFGLRQVVRPDGDLRAYAFAPAETQVDEQRMTRPSR